MRIIINRFTVPVMVLIMATITLQFNCIQCQQNNVADVTCLTENDAIQMPHKDDRKNLYQSEQAFSFSLLRAVNETEPNSQIFFSPYSTYQALLLAYFGANGATEQELENALNLQWAQSKMNVFHAYRSERSKRMIGAQNGASFKSADKIYISKQAQLKSCINSLFPNECESLDFADNPEAALQQINEFVSNETYGNIQDILPPGSLSSQTKLVLANAAYFKGQWASKFDTEDTTKEVFFISSDKTTFVDMMKITGNFYHGVNEQLGCHVLEMPYTNENHGQFNDISMVIFLPPLQTELSTILNRLTPETFERALEDGGEREVIVKFPKFSFENSYGLIPIVQKLGVETLFTQAANLTGFSTVEQLSLDDAIHKAKIEVNEDGSTAAAATVLFSFRSARPLQPAQFNCNHPFLFFIYERNTNVILFTGVYRGGQ